GDDSSASASTVRNVATARGQRALAPIGFACGTALRRHPGARVVSPEPAPPWRDPSRPGM
ncbi:MAG: hypothetical protein AVDCRST_MAG19-4050, partial [uncultured Thermomicrobiales bacterium]